MQLRSLIEIKTTAIGVGTGVGFVTAGVCDVDAILGWSRMDESGHVTLQRNAA